MDFVLGQRRFEDLLITFEELGDHFPRPSMLVLMQNLSQSGICCLSPNSGTLTPALLTTVLPLDLRESLVPLDPGGIGRCGMQWQSERPLNH